MLKSAAPTQYVIPWANSGTKNAIPVASQIGITNGAASYTDGYPPLTFTPIASGGVPPFGSDTNGILYNVTLSSLWQQSGFLYNYNSTFSTNQGGYPAQSLVVRSDGKGLWLNTTDSNTGNPDATGGNAGWLSVRANVGSTSIAVVAGNNTPDPSTLGPRLLIITGSIASTASLILPLTSGSSWVVYNTTSGAGSLSVQGATGSGVTVAQGVVSEVITDGTNFYTSTFNGSGVYLPINGTAVAATKLATARTIAMTGDVSWTSPAFDGTANVTAAGTIAAGAVTLAKMASFQANSLMGNPTGAAATPSAITLTNGIQFSGTALGLGNITPTSVTVNGVTSIGSSGAITINTVASNAIALTLTNTSSNGAQIALQGNGSTTPNKTIRAFGGLLQVVNSAGTAAIYSLDDSGNGTFSGSVSGTTASFSGTGTIGSTLAVNGGTITTTLSGVTTYWQLNPFGISGTFGVGTASNIPFIIGMNNAESLRVAAGGIVTMSGSSSVNGAQLVMNGSGGTTPNKTVRTRAGSLEIVNSANTAIIWSLDDAGDTSQTGTINFSTSDATLKNLGEPIAPKTFHRLPYYAYTRLDTGAKGWGPTAQDAREIEPAYVREYDYLMPDGSIERKLHLAKEQITQDTAFWAARQVDDILARLERAGI